jgi:hypothetical protein
MPTYDTKGLRMCLVMAAVATGLAGVVMANASQVLVSGFDSEDCLRDLRFDDLLSDDQDVRAGNRPRGRHQQTRAECSRCCDHGT